MRLFRSIFLSGLHFLYLFLCLVIADKIYARYEKFPFKHTIVTLQRWQSSSFRPANTLGLIYEMIPNLVNKYVKTNSMGIRDGEYKIPKPPDTFRIVILGDSVVYGTGLEQGEVFSVLLGGKLNSGRSKIDYEVINCSVPGYNTMQEYTAFITEWHMYEPDLVLVFSCNNDMALAFIQWEDSGGLVYNYLAGTPIKDHYFIYLSPYEIMSISMPNLFHLPSFIHRRLMLYSSLYRTSMIKLYDFLSAKNEYKYPSQAYLNIVKDQAAYAIKHLNLYCKNNHIDLIFILFPLLFDIIPPDIHDHITEIKKILDINNIKYLDLKPYYSSRIDSLVKIRCLPTDFGHLNNIGHRLTADVLYDYLIAYLENKITKK